MNDELREWARGMYALEAAAELLIRTSEAQGRSVPGARRTDDGRLWLDAEAVLDDTAAGSGGEQRIAAIAASLLGGPPVDLSEVLPGLDRDQLALVLAAVAHAGGSHRHTDPPRVTMQEDGTPLVTRGSGELLGSLHPWPAG